MPWLKYRYWNSDGQLARKAIVGNREYVFYDTDEGICNIPYKKDADYLLHHESKNYELAWEKYGVEFDAEGKEKVPAVVVQEVKTFSNADAEKEAPKRVKRKKAR